MFTLQSDFTKQNENTFLSEHDLFVKSDLQSSHLFSFIPLLSPFSPTAGTFLSTYLFFTVFGNTSPHFLCSLYSHLGKNDVYSTRSLLGYLVHASKEAMGYPAAPRHQKTGCLFLISAATPLMKYCVA